MTAVHVFTVPVQEFPAALLNANALRGETRHLGRLAAPWRRLGAQLVTRHGLPRPFPGPVRIDVEFRFENNRRRDTGNLAPTVKALVDGLVDAGALVDDCDGLVEGPFPRRTYPNGPRRIRFVITPLHPADVGREYPHDQKGPLT